MVTISRKKESFVGVRLEKSTRAKLEKLARDSDVTMTQLVRRAVREFLDRQQQKAA